MCNERNRYIDNFSELTKSMKTYLQENKDLLDDFGRKDLHYGICKSYLLCLYKINIDILLLIRTNSILCFHGFRLVLKMCAEMDLIYSDVMSHNKDNLKKIIFADIKQDKKIMKCYDEINISFYQKLLEQIKTTFIDDIPNDSINHIDKENISPDTIKMLDTIFDSLSKKYSIQETILCSDYCIKLSREIDQGEIDAPSVYKSICRWAHFNLSACQDYLINKPANLDNQTFEGDFLCAFSWIINCERNFLNNFNSIIKMAYS